MEQMFIDPEMRVEIDFEDNNLPSTVRQLQPVVFKDEDSFCCLLGPDPQAGVFGCGSTPQQAISDWDEHLKALIESHNEDDAIAQYVIDTLNIKKGDVW